MRRSYWFSNGLSCLDELARLRQQHAGPTVDVVVVDLLLHSGHALLLLFGRHGQRRIECIGKLIRGIGVDLQGIVQFAGRAGEPREDQHSLAVVP